MNNLWASPKNHPISESKARELMAGDYGKELCKIMQSYIAPIFIPQATDTGPKVLSNETVFFWDTESSIFAVTAKHVFDDLVKITNQQDYCQIQNLKIYDLKDRLIEQNSKYDIATFRITEQELKKIEKTPITGAAIRPEVGRGMMFGGFPGHERKELGPNHLGMGCFVSLGIVSIQ